MCRVLLHKFGVVQVHRTSSNLLNHIIAGIPRYVELSHMSSGWLDCTKPHHRRDNKGRDRVLHMSLGWFDCTEPSLTSSLHCNNFMIILTNKNSLSCIFVLSALGTEQRYKQCARCMRYHPGGLSGRTNDSPLVY